MNKPVAELTDEERLAVLDALGVVDGPEPTDIEKVKALSAYDAARVSVELGLASDLGPAFTPEPDEQPLGTRVGSPFGDGVVVEYVEQYVDGTGTTKRRVHLVQLGDGALRAVSDPKVL